VLVHCDLNVLRSDLAGLANQTLTGILVGVGSTVLHFSDGSSVLVHCSFEALDGRTKVIGHGENPADSVALFGLLNQSVSSTGVDVRGAATLHFRSGGAIRIIPDNSGFESYVLRTSKGVFPVT
jgi:hypothetical protein